MSAIKAFCEELSERMGLHGKITEDVEIIGNVLLESDYNCDAQWTRGVAAAVSRMIQMELPIWCRPDSPLPHRCAIAVPMLVRFWNDYHDNRRQRVDLNTVAVEVCEQHGWNLTITGKPGKPLWVQAGRQNITIHGAATT